MAPRLERVLSLLPVLAGFTAGAATAQDAHLSAQERSAVGCYALTVEGGLAGDVRTRIPSVVALETDRREHGIWLRLEPPIDRDGRVLEGSWRLHPYGGFRIVWSDGFSGLLILADWTPDGFTGTIRTMTDVVGAEASESPLQGRRTDCSSMRGGPDPP